jgi:hypothetical protein
VRRTSTVDGACRGWTTREDDLPPARHGDLHLDLAVRKEAEAVSRAQGRGGGRRRCGREGDSGRDPPTTGTRTSTSSLGTRKPDLGMDPRGGGRARRRWEGELEQHRRWREQGSRWAGERPRRLTRRHRHAIVPRGSPATTCARARACEPCSTRRPYSYASIHAPAPLLNLPW